MTKHLLTLAAATSLLAGAATGALAQTSLTPGKQLQENGSVSGFAGAWVMRPASSSAPRVR